MYYIPRLKFKKTFTYRSKELWQKTFLTEQGVNLNLL